MKLYIKQKVFSWGDRFSVKDASGNDRYFVEGEVFSWGKKLHVYDPVGNEVAFIQQKVFSFLPTYHVFVNGSQAAEIVKEFSFFKPYYSIHGPGWEATGRFLLHDYEITQGEFPVASIQKEWMTWGDCYELDVPNPNNEVLALAVVLTIDCVIDQSNNCYEMTFVKR